MADVTLSVPTAVLTRIKNNLDARDGGTHTNADVKTFAIKALKEAATSLDSEVKSSSLQATINAQNTTDAADQATMASDLDGIN